MQCIESQPQFTLPSIRKWACICFPKTESLVHRLSLTSAPFKQIGLCCNTKHSPLTRVALFLEIKQQTLLSISFQAINDRAFILFIFVRSQDTSFTIFKIFSTLTRLQMTLCPCQLKIIDIRSTFPGVVKMKLSHVDPIMQKCLDKAFTTCNNPSQFIIFNRFDCNSMQYHLKDSRCHCGHLYL